MYSDEAARCLVPIIGASPGITGHLIEQATCKEMEKRMGDFSAPEILHLGSGSERRDEDKHSDLAERKQSASLGVYSAEKFMH